MTTLYKTLRGNTRVWMIHTEGNQVIIKHGLLNGNLQTDTIEQPNPGSAEAMMKSKVTAKISREGYSASPESEPPGLPMLLHQFRQHSSKLPDNVIYQPKLNGYRCVATRETMLSRKNDPIVSFPHIQEALSKLPAGVVVDGELYCHGKELEWHGTQIRSYEPQPGYHEMEYYIFDIQMPGPYRERHNVVHEFFDVGVLKRPIVTLPVDLGNKSEAESRMAEYLKFGYEGAVIRDPFGLYEKDYRSYAVQKLKPLFKGWFPVTGFTAATKGREEGAAIAICRTADGQEFKSRIAMDLNSRKDIYAMRHTIKTAAAHIQFEDWTAKGIPQHSRCLELRIGRTIRAEEIPTPQGNHNEDPV